jgi:hypothetical protein
VQNTTVTYDMAISQQSAALAVHVPSVRRLSCVVTLDKQPSHNKNRGPSLDNRQVDGKSVGTERQRINWRRAIAAGALWAVVYDYGWGVAWFAFMHREWLDAANALHRRMPWTAEVWFAWVTITLVIGVLVAAYAKGQERHPSLSALYASLSIWIVMTAGFCFWWWEQGFSVRVLVLDSAVNLAGMAMASLVAGWSQRDLSPL